MCWNPPDPSDYVDMALADDEQIETYSIRIFHPDSTPTIEEFTEVFEYYARIEDLWMAKAEYEVINSPDDIPF